MRTIIARCNKCSFEWKSKTEYIECECGHSVDYTGAGLYWHAGDITTFPEEGKVVFFS